MHNDTRQLLSTAEAAQLVNKDRSTISRWVKSGRLEFAQRTSGGMLLFTSEAVRAAVENETAES